MVATNASVYVMQDIMSEDRTSLGWLIFACKCVFRRMCLDGMLQLHNETKCVYKYPMCVEQR